MVAYVAEFGGAFSGVDRGVARADYLADDGVMFPIGESDGLCDDERAEKSSGCDEELHDDSCVGWWWCVKVGLCDCMIVIVMEE